MRLSIRNLDRTELKFNLSWLSGVKLFSKKDLWRKKLARKLSLSRVEEKYFFEKVFLS